MRPYTSDLAELRSQMNRMFGEGEEAPRLWAPAVDVSESEHEIVLHVEVPGMKKDEIDIQLSGDTLTLRGERRQQTEQKGERYHRIERQYGAWQRTFAIETPIDHATITAGYEDGVLEVHLPKRQEVKARQIEIQVK